MTFYRIGVIGNIIQLLKLPDGTVKVLVEAQKRVRITKIATSSVFFQGQIEEISDEDASPVETEIFNAISH